MNLKKKIYLVLIFLLLIVVSLGYFASDFINQLDADTQLIIKDNYKTIEFVDEMQNAVEIIFETGVKVYQYDSINIQNYETAVRSFRLNLDKEKLNITEPGEKELTADLDSVFSEYMRRIKEISENHKNTFESLLMIKAELRRILREIHQLNSDAIIEKNIRAQTTSERVSLYMGIAVLAAVLLSVILLVYFPGYLVNPISQLTYKIKEISLGNYNQKLEMNTRDELGELARAFNVMAQRLKEYEQNSIHNLLIEKNRLEAIIKGLSDAVIILDENKNVLYVNQVLLDLTGMKSDDLAGKYAPDVAANNDLIRYLIRDLMNVNSSSAKINNPPVRIVVGKKERFYTREITEIKNKDFRNPADSTAGYICVLKNITEFEERDTAKTNLIATVSHELKTPLSSINLNIKLLENAKLGTLNDEQKKIIISIRQQTGRLSRMVNELLDYSQTESGNIKLRMTDVSPVDILDYAVTAMMVILAEKNIQLDTQIPEDLPMVHADLEKTVWVLTNLITNAIRFTPENGLITICINNERKFVKFIVKDKGPGISSDDQEKIFQKFVQVGDANAKGRGLGLAISKEFVASQGGSIGVKSELGIGSSFYFTLPSVNP